MFDRSLCKQKARTQLKGNYGSAVGVVAVSTLISAGLSGLALSENSFVWLFSMAATGIITFGSAVFFLKFALKKPGETISFNSFVAALAQWLTGITSFLWFTLWGTLWALLFIIPGIIKMLAYSQMFFILAENPSIGVRKAMKMSMVMTKGYKGEILVMALSFFGWFFLSVLTCGILFLWVTPYFNVSFANAYLYLKEQALQSAHLTPADFLMPQKAEQSENQKTAETDAAIDVTVNQEETND